MVRGLTVVEPVTAVLDGTIDGLPLPLWIPWPVPPGWTFAGLASRAEALDSAATVSAWTGVDPFGDPLEVIFVCEEAGAGVGSHFAGLDVRYPSRGVGEGPPHARFEVDARPVPLWAVDGCADRAVYAGEATGRWLWVVMHPAESGAMVVSPMSLVDARSLGAEWTVIPLGELSPRLLVD